MKTYTEENQIADLIQNNNSIACSAKIEPMVEDKLNYLRDYLQGSKHPTDMKLESEDLFPFISLFVSANWNFNDDVFTKEELYKARKTPKDHPCNIDHNQSDIVGHITDIWMVDANYNILSDDTPLEQLPDLIHLVSANVLYTVWKDEDKQKFMDAFIVDILAGNKSVSMECVFYDFDYAMMDNTSGSYFTVARNEETAFLTKHLRIYGGAGNYGNYKIGRQIKDLVFIGKGIVEDPANPYSKIFNTSKMPPFVSSAKLNLEDFLKKANDTGVIVNEDNLKLEKVIMSCSNECKCKDQIAALEAGNLELTKQLEALQTKASEADKQVAELTDSLSQSKAQYEEAMKKSQELETSLAGVNTKLSETKAEFTKFQRVNELKNLTLSEADINDMMTNFGEAEDKTWAAVVKLAGKKVADAKPAQSVAGVIVEDTKNALSLSEKQADVTNAEDDLFSAIKTALAKKSKK